MPEVARFFGIIVPMYAEAGEPRHRPHLHAYAGESTAVVAIDGLEVIGGGLPRRQERLLLARVELHCEELLMNWRRLQEGRPTFPIDPPRYDGRVHEIYRVTELRVVAPYSLWLKFDDGLERTIEFAPLLSGEIYGPLRDSKLFAAATIDAEVGTVTWPNGADFDPETLHNWPRYEAALRKRAEVWSAARA